MNECAICDRLATPGSVYCEYHSKAYDNLRDAFEKWKESLEIEWDKYLKQLLETEGTGLWIQEIAEYIIQQGSI
ncbi:MAG: hypothetical protein JSW61_13540 [Candidatus Thorarchaeota archaeon]|nr:MAG: hypothetical protein JSW61_13540 [Candidatus Thorarchaeota archaeon]